MRLSRVYIPEPLRPGFELNISGETCHYLSRVLRLREGDELRLFNSADFSLMLDPGGSDTISGAGKISSINLLVGPEGGFSDEELTLAKERGVALVGLGSRIRRTETAPVAALAILQHVYGDLP